MYGVHEKLTFTLSRSTTTKLFQIKIANVHKYYTWLLVYSLLYNKLSSYHSQSEYVADLTITSSEKSNQATG